VSIRLVPLFPSLAKDPCHPHLTLPHPHPHPRFNHNQPRFLDAQRIHALTSYLEALHSRGLAGADHTTLLLNCYTKLRDVAKLDTFIHGTASPPSAASSNAPSGGATAGERSGAGTPVGGSSPVTKQRSQKAAAAAAAPGPSFDLETAFRVLRTAGYFGHALAVAARAKQAEWRLDVLLEDTQQFDDAIAFIGEPVGWLLGCLVAWLLGWLVAWLVGWLVGWLVVIYVQ